MTTYRSYGIYAKINLIFMDCLMGVVLFSFEN